MEKNNNEIKLEICQTKQLNLSARLDNIIGCVLKYRADKMKELIL